MNKQVFKNRFMYMINSFGFKFSFIVVLGLCLYNTFIISYNFRFLDIASCPSPNETFILKYLAHGNEYLLMLYIFILLFPFSFSYIKEQKLAINSIIQARCNVKQLYITNLICCFLGTFIVFMVPFVIEMLINKIVFFNCTGLLSGAAKYSYAHSATISGDNVFANTVSKGVPLLALFIKHTFAYNLLFAFIFSSFCGLMAVFIYCISKYMRKLSILLFLPLYLINFLMDKLDSIMDYDGKKYLNLRMSDYITIESFYGKSYLYFLILIVLFLSIIAIITLKTIHSDQLE